MDPRVAFYDGLASMLGAGIPIRTALESLSSRSGGSFGEAVRHLRDGADAGRPLAEAMEERPASFPRYEVEVVRAAETAGTLERAARSLAEGLESAARIRRRLVTGLVYPLAVLHLAPVPANIATLMQGKPAAFVLRCVLFLLPLWLVAAGFWWLLRRARNGGAAARALLAIPLLGGFLRDAALVRWARAFAALEDAGVPADACALRSAAATGLASLEEPLAAPAVLVRQGISRAAAYAAAPLPAEMYRALSQGEVTGTIARSLEHAAGALESRLQTRMEAVVKLAPVFATILVGAVVLWVAASVLGGFYGRY